MEQITLHLYTSFWPWIVPRGRIISSKKDNIARALLWKHPYEPLIFSHQVGSFHCVSSLAHFLTFFPLLLFVFFQNRYYFVFDFAFFSNSTLFLIVCFCFFSFRYVRPLSGSVPRIKVIESSV